ncbi:hypothetical protein [Paludisphaera mucosa]|uniref:Uncharacterized protein n=1 Tax=Paludisphaera mucosa TaxID=3030827 RepID=A0ABT6FHP9_9BACT|nr:hypothetical protein [Paludisphaera mucosa]MDG3007102.1 hypothetical protein [Paludisphaera mucosa]
MGEEGSGAAALGGPGAWPASDAEQVRRIESMPREVGVLLMVAGVGGLLLPGPVGSPFLILGGVILWPRAFRGLEGYFGRRFPKLHHQSMRQITRYLDDLEKRYPLEK